MCHTCLPGGLPAVSMSTRVKFGDRPDVVLVRAVHGAHAGLRRLDLRRGNVGAVLSGELEDAHLPAHPDALFAGPFALCYL